MLFFWQFRMLVRIAPPRLNDCSIVWLDTLALNDPRRSQMQSLIEQGRVLDAAKIASQDDNFLNLTVRQFAAPMSNRAESPRVPLNDFIAMFIGTTRDNRDARELLSGNYLYIGNSNDPSFRSSCTSPSCSYSPSPMATQAHFTAIDRTNLAKHLLRIQPQRPDISDAAGVLTSYAWAESFFSAGTNRRATAYALQEFLCTSIQEMADTTLSDYRVRRDVDRAPGGDANTYQTECRGCHTGMDGLSGAWAHFDYNPDNRILQSAGIRGKMNQNNSVFPGGHITVDNSWVNLFTRNQNAALQWRGAMTGRGCPNSGPCWPTAEPSRSAWPNEHSSESVIANRNHRKRPSSMGSRKSSRHRDTSSERSSRRLPHFPCVWGNEP